MQILIVSHQTDLFQEVQDTCRRLFAQCVITHSTDEGWDEAGIEDRRFPRWIIIDAAIAARTIGRAELNFAADSWVASRFIAGGDGGLSTPWELFSRSDFPLRAQQVAMGCDQESEFREQTLLASAHLRVTDFCLRTRCSLIPLIRDRLLKSIEDFMLAPEAVQKQFCMALDEALANAFYHGNLELCSLLKEDGSNRFRLLAAERENLQPWSGRCVRVTEIAASFGLWITIQDEGRGFDVAAALERANDPENLLSSGRGLLMMQAFADELFFNTAGNQVTLVLYSRTPGTRINRSSCQSDMASA